MTKSREQIITGMCYTYRHDFGLDKPDNEGFTSPLTSGMTKSERQILWDQMAEIFDNDIAPYMEIKNESRTT